MNCPYCRREIGVYVELNSEAYRRVARGCCPHCGRSMPSGHSVGFDKPKYNPQRRPEQISSDTYEKSKSDATGWKILSYSASFTGGFLLTKLIGSGSFSVVSSVAGLLYVIIFSVITYFWYFYIDRFDNRYTKDDIRSGAFAIFLWIVCLILLVVNLINSSISILDTITIVVIAVILWLIRR